LKVNIIPIIWTLKIIRGEGKEFFFGGGAGYPPAPHNNIVKPLPVIFANFRLNATCMRNSCRPFWKILKFCSQRLVERRKGQGEGVGIGFLKSLFVSNLVENFEICTKGGLKRR